MADQPTSRLLRIAQMDLEDLQQYGRKAVSSLVSGEERAAAQTALAVLNQALAAAGGLDGTSTEGAGLPLPEKLHSA